MPALAVRGMAMPALAILMVYTVRPTPYTVYCTPPNPNPNPSPNPEPNPTPYTARLLTLTLTLFLTLALALALTLTLTLIPTPTLTLTLAPTLALALTLPLALTLTPGFCVDGLEKEAFWQSAVYGWSRSNCHHAYPAELGALYAYHIHMRGGGERDT